MKKVLCLILVAIMLMTVMPVTSFAGNWLCEITGHDFEWQVTKAATCQSTGTETEICTRSDCGTTRNTRTINLTSHTITTIPAKAPTCDVDGYTEGKACSVCDYIEVGCQPIESTGHTSVVVPAVDATCTKDGNAAGKKCKVCDFVIEGCKVIKAKGHKEQVVKGTPATCTEKGMTDASYCTVCNKAIKEPVVIPAIGHDYFTLIEEDASCELEGKIVECCANCSYENVIIIPAKGHSYQSQWQTILEPKCTETGIAIKICKDCFGIQTYDVPPIGHTDVDFDGKCDRCGTTNGLPQPEDPADSCSCNCHKSGFEGFIWKILSFFYKLFRTNGTCSCGAAHY